MNEQKLVRTVTTSFCKTKLTLRQRLMKLQYIPDEEHCNEWGSLVVQTLRTTTYDCYHGVFNSCLLQRRVAKHQTWRVSKTSTAWHLPMCHSGWYQLHLLLKLSGAPSNVALDWKTAVYSERPTMTARPTGRKTPEKIAAVVAPPAPVSAASVRFFFLFFCWRRHRSIVEI